MDSRQVMLAQAGLCVTALLAGCESQQPTSRLAQFDRSYRMGCAELSMGDAKAAREHFQAAAGFRNDHALTHYYLGVSHAMLHEDDQALVGLGRAIRLDPTLAAAYYNIGTIHLRHRRFRQAAEALEKSVELDADNPKAFNNLAKAYYMLTLPELAVTAYETALQLDPNSRNALAGLCRLALAAGSKDRASQYLRRLERLDPDAPDVVELRRSVAKN